MDCRYQIFVSSTFTNLQIERAKVFKVLMDLGHLPAGMENFPAMDEEQMEFIKRVIDESDYYLLIIAGKYGSLSPSGLAYTELEYEYAVSKGMKVVALLHGEPGSLRADATEINPEGMARLNAFREKVKNGRLVKFWTNSDELAAHVATSLPALIRTYPAVGWVRGNVTSSREILSEINELRKENERLKTKLSNANKKISETKSEIKNLQSLEAITTLSGEASDYFQDPKKITWKISVRWIDAFLAIAPALKQVMPKSELDGSLKKLVRAHVELGEYDGIRVDRSTLNLLEIQFLAHKLISVKTNSYDEELWIFAPKGHRLYIAHMAVKDGSPEEDC